MPTDPQHETVAAALLTALRQIGSQGSPDYFYRPKEVFRARFYRESYLTCAETYIILRGGSSTWEREMNCEWLVEREFFVLYAREERNAEEQPWRIEPSDGGEPPTLVQERMLADIEQALANDTLGEGPSEGPAERVDITGVEYGYDYPAYTMLETTLLVTYRIPKRTVN